MFKRIKHKGLKEWGQAIMLALILALFIKGFVFQAYIMQSKRMEKTILSGDYVYVNKLVYGARLPVTLLSLPFFPSCFSPSITIPAWRLPAFAKIRHNNIIAFNNPTEITVPIDKREVIIKRCVGLPGDTLEINDKKLLINHSLVVDIENIQHNYRIVGAKSKIDKKILNSYGVTQGTKVSDIGIYEYAIPCCKVDELKKELSVRYVRELKDFKGENSDKIFPHHKQYTFTKDFFGPVQVPFAGQILKLTSQNYPLYKTIIEQFEENMVEISGSGFRINGTLTNKYQVKNNYYFVMDDNRDNANDSRYWGFLPESHIIGKATFVWFSDDKEADGVRWERCFTRMN